MADYKKKKGASGKKYTTLGEQILVTYTDGSTRRVKPGDDTYNATKEAMQKDIKAKKFWKPAGNSKTTAETAVGKGVTDGIITTAEKNKLAEQAQAAAKQRKQAQAVRKVADGRSKQPATEQAKVLNNAINTMIAKKAVDTVKSAPKVVKSGVEHGVHNTIAGTKQGAVSGMSNLGRGGMAEAMPYMAVAETLGAVKPGTHVNLMQQQKDGMEALQRVIAENTRRKSQQISDKYGPMSNGEQFISDFIAGLLPVGAAVAGGAIAGPAGAIAPMYNYAKGASVTQALNDGADYDEAQAYGIGKGAVDTGASMIFKGMAGLPGKFKVGEKVAGKIANPALKKAGGAIADVASEGAEEALAEIIDPLLQRATYNEDAKLDWNRVLESAIMGSLTAGAFNAGAAGLRNLPKIAGNMQENDQQRAFDALHSQKFQPKQVESAETAQDSPEQAQSIPTTEHFNGIENGAQAQNMQADFQPKAGKNIQKQKPVQNEPKKTLEMSERTFENVGDKNVRAYQQENPAVKPFYQRVADNLLADLQMGVKGGRDAGVDPETRTVTTMGGWQREQSEPIERMLRDGMTYNQIEDGLQRIVEDHGKENTANAKRAELYVDDAVRKGYRSVVEGDVTADRSFAYRGMTAEQLQEVYNRLENSFTGNPETDAGIISEMETVQNLLDGMGTVAENATVEESSNVIVKNVPNESDMPRIQNEYKNSTDESMYDFIDDARASDKTRYYKMSPVSDSEAADIKRLTGIDVTGFARKLSSDTIRHIDNRHGVKGAADSSLKDDADIARMNYVLENYDTIEDGGYNESHAFVDKNNKPAPMVRYSKRVNGTYYVVEAVPDTARKSLQIVTAYKSTKKEASKHVVDADRTNLPQPNVQNAHAPDASFVDNIIPENQQEDNANSVGRSNRKVSQFYTNTMQKTPLFTEAERNLFEASEYEHDVVSEKESIRKATERLENDYEGTKKELQEKEMLTGDDVDAAMFFVQEGLETGRETGDYSQAKAWTKKIQESTTVEGRAVQALAKYSRTTAEGIMVQAQKYVKQSEDALKTDRVLGKEKDSAKWRKVEAETEQATKVIEEAETKAQQSAEEKLSETLAARAESMVKGSSRERELTDKQIVNELYNVLTETGIPDNRPKGKTDVYKYLRHAVENKDRYTEVWEKAQKLLIDKYSADTEQDIFMRDSLEKFFASGIIPTYSKKTTTSAVKQSAKELGIDLREIIKKNNGDKGSAMMQIADRIVQMTGVAPEDARLLTSEVMSAYTSTLREYTEKRLKQLFPETATMPGRKKTGPQSEFDKVMELINLGAYDRQDIVDVIKQRNNLPVLTNADIKVIQENVEAANQYERYSYEWKKHMAKAQQVAVDKMPQATKNKITQLKRLMELSNPRTDVKNITGNVPLAGTEVMSDVIGAFTDIAISKVRGTDRTTTVNPHLVEFMKGFGLGVKDTVKDIRNDVNTYRMGEESTTQYEMPRGRTFQNTTGGIRGGINDFLNGMDKIVNYGLMFGDRPFFEAHYAKRMAQLKQLGYDAEAPETKADAYAYAVDMVFQSNSDMAKGASGMREALNNLLTINGFALGDFVLPFVQTPANIAEKVLDYSPVGFAKAMGQTYNSGIKKTAPFDQRLFCQNVGRSLTGTAILGIGYALAEAGIITGSPDDEAEKRNAMTVAGWKPYSFYIDGKYYDYSYIQPVGILLAMAADAYQEGQSAEDLSDWVAMAGAGIKGGVDCFFNMSFFSSLTDFFGGYGSPAENMGSAFMDFPTQFAPAIFNAANKSIDPYQRETYASDPLKRTINKFMAKTPLSQKLPIKQNVYGEDMMQNQGREVMKRTIENMLAPSTVSEKTTHKLNDELLRLNKDTGLKTQFLSYPDKKQDLGSAGVYKLNDGEEYNAFIKNANGYAREQMNKLIQDDYYKGLSDEEKIEALGQIEEIGKYKAKQELAKAHGTSYSTDEMENKLKSLEECGNDYAKYHAIQNGFSGDELESKIKKMEVCDRLSMDYATYDEVTGLLSGLHDSTDENGKTIKGKARKDKVYAALVEQRNAGKITDEQMWYIWVDSYNAKTRDKKSSLPYWKDCPYKWIVDAKVAEKEADAEAKKNRQ